MLLALSLVATTAFARSDADREASADRRENDHHEAAEARADKKGSRAESERRTPSRHKPAVRHGRHPRHKPAMVRHHGHGRPVVVHRPAVVVHSAPVVVSKPAPRGKAQPFPKSKHSLSLTLDTVGLVQGVADVTADFKLANTSSLALQGALGSDGQQGLYSLGLEFRQNLGGNFDNGVYLGLGADYGNVHMGLPTATGFAAGPSLGGKLTVPGLGLTIGADIGGDVVVTDHIVALAPTLGFSAGFSF